MRAFVGLLALLLVGSFAGAEQLTGVVLKDDGTPAPGATVNVAAIFRSPPVRLTTMTNDKGAFAVDLEQVHESTRYAVAVRWEMQGTVLTDATDSHGKSVKIQGQKLPPILIRLRLGGRLYGKVLREEDGGPIVGARLFLDTGEVVTSNNQGDFELVGLEMRGHSLIPVSPGRVRQYVLFDTTLRPDTELELRLPRGASLKGHVLNEQGQPVSGAYITRASSGNALTMNGWDEVCAADGSYEYGGLSPQRLFYNVEVQSPGYRSHSVSSEVTSPTQVIQRDIHLTRNPNRGPAPRESEDIETAPASTLTAELPRHTIEGVVSDDKGRPIEGAVVRWGAFLWDSSVPSTLTGSGGKYALTRVPEGKGAIMAVADDFAPEFITVQAGDKQMDLQLSRGTSVHGVIRGTAGKPIAGARVIPLVHCLEMGFCNAIWLDERRANTNDNGEFRLDALPTAGLMFDILKDGYSEQRNVTLKTDDANEIQLHAGGAIRGLVIDAQRKPVRNFKIRLLIPRIREPNERAGGYYAGFDWYGVSYTRDDGVFVLTDIGAHAWMRMIVSSPGIGRTVFDRVQSEPMDQLSPPEGLTIPLEPFQTLMVQVRDHKSGVPIADAQVALLEDESNSKQFNWGYKDLWATRTLSNSTGTAMFDEPICFDGTILVTASGYARKRIAWTDRAQQVDAVLEPAAALTGEVRLADKLVSEGYVRLSSALDHFSVNLQESGGRFAFDRLPAGQYTLEITGTSGQRLHTDEVTLEAGTPHVEVVTLANKDR